MAQSLTIKSPIPEGSYTIESPETVAHLQDPGPIWQPPSQDELPYDDGEPMESHRHRLQMELLINPLLAHFPERDMFVGGNMFVYYQATQAGRREFVGPDVFVALDVTRNIERKSWVVWGEGKGPDVVIELLSESTAASDRGSKKLIYQNTLRVPEYFFYDPFSGECAGFDSTGRGYQPMAMDEHDRLISQQLQLALVRWEGTFTELSGTWLRWATLDGVLLPTDAERVLMERQHAEEERQHAEEERQHAEEESQRADDLAALVARYRERFGDLNGGS